MYGWGRQPKVQAVKEQMERHEITFDNVPLLSLPNECTSTLAIEYGVRYIPGFDLDPFMEAFLFYLLRQPQRDGMISALLDATFKVGMRKGQAAPQSVSARESIFTFRKHLEAAVLR